MYVNMESSVIYKKKYGPKDFDDQAQFNILPRFVPRRKRKEELSRSGRIISGSTANLGLLPHQVSLQLRNYRHQNICGGSILTNMWVLSAAHCFLNEDGEAKTYGDTETVTSPSSYDVVLGLKKLHYSDVFSSQAQRIQLSEWIFYDDVNIYSTKKHDLALLKTSKNIKFNYYVKPVCLPVNEEILEPGQACIISGFGIVEGGSRADKLQYAEINIRTNEECHVYRTNYNKTSQICVGGQGIIAGNGDSGSPLTCLVNREGSEEVNQVLYGVSSFSAATVNKYQPNVYTKVSHYISWINKNTNFQNRGQYFHLKETKSGTNEAVETAVPNINCYYKNESGENYVGNKNTTSSGKRCIRWGKLSRRNDYNPEQWLGQKSNGNFCRNPDHDPKGPWCFVRNQRTATFQFCGIPFCENLKAAHNKPNNDSVTEQTLSAVDLISMEPLTPGIPINTTNPTPKTPLTANIENSTHLPNKEEIYIEQRAMHPNFNYRVSSSVETAPTSDCLEGNGFYYRGKVSQTNRGFQCLAWGDLKIKNKYHPSKNSGKDLRYNFCRNPNNDEKGPWCYFRKPVTKFIRYQYCEIKRCQ